MRRWILGAGVVVVGLAVVVVVAVANLSRFVDARRDWLAGQVRARLGREVTIGSIGVTLRGGLGVRVADVRVADDPRIGGDFLRAAEVRVSVRLLPALFGRYEIRRITLGAPVVTVIRDADGWNVDSLGRERAARPPRDRAEPRERSEGLAVLVSLLEVRDGEVRYVDRRRDPPGELTARQVGLSLSDASLARPIAVELTAALLASEPNLRLAGRVGPVGDPPDPSHMPVDLALELSDVDAGALPAVAAALDLVPPRDLVAAGPVSLRGRAHGPLPQLAVEATLDAGRAEVRWGRGVSKAGGVALDAEVSGVRDGDALAVRAARLALGDAEMRAAGSLRPGTPWVADLTLDADGAPLAALAAAVPAAATMDVGGAIDAHLTVQGALAEDPPPAVQGTITLSGVRARRAGDTHGLSDLQATIAVQDGVARLPTTTFRIGDAPVEVAGAFTLAERLLTVERLAAEAFDGRLEASGSVAFGDGRRPRFAVDASARNVALQPLLAARGARAAEHLEGHLDATVALAGLGFRREAVRRTLTGSARLDVRDGVLRGLNVVDQVLGSVVGIGPERMATLVPARLRTQRPDLFGAADTRFEELGATVRIADGRARTDDLTLRTSAYSVTGRGRIDFAGDVDLVATFVASRELTADILASVKHARWVTNDRQLVEVPFRVAGRFPHLRPQPDPAFLARAVGRALESRARKALGMREKSEDEDSVVDDAIDRLRQLFGR